MNITIKKSWCIIEKYCAVLEINDDTYTIEAYSYDEVMRIVNETVKTANFKSLVVTKELVRKHISD